MNSSLSTTPPDRQIQLPSPPSSNEKPSAVVSSALGLFRLHREGVLAPGWNQLSIQPADYHEFLRQLDRDKELRQWIEVKIPYDYDPDECLLALRMTTLTHEVFLHSFVRDIEEQLQTIATEVPDELASIVANIVNQGHGHVFLWGETSTDNWRNVSQRCPDAGFRHPLMLYPRVIVEVSYSQRRKPLEYLADSYITDSCGGVGVVVGVDLEYRGSSESRVMVWRPKLTRDNGETFLESELVVSQVLLFPESALHCGLHSQQNSQSFCNSQGHGLPGSLTLPVSDFLLPSSIPDPPPQHNVTIPFSSLSTYFTKALTLESITKQRRGQTPALPPDVKVRKRKRTLTPPLSEEREKRFREDTRRAREASERVDGDFVLSMAGQSGTPSARSGRRLREKEEWSYDEGDD
ncbi:MAG: hypothetical protein M1839_003565 [Geoglossum umbratile]|nr:MAG: hypothetical protein M1839_003565 [Geoglossum umbratile]